MTRSSSESHLLGHIGRFFLYVIRTYALARWTLLLTLLLLLLEYASLSLMIPLSAGVTGSSTSPSTLVVMWTAFAARVGLPPTLMTWLWLFLVLLALRSGTGYAHLCLTTLLSKQVHRELSKRVFAQIVFDEPMTEIYRRSVGFYISLGGDDTFRAGTLINSALQVLAAIVSVGAGLVLLFMFSSTAFNVTLVFLFISSIGVTLIAAKLVRLDGKAVALSREARTGFLEALNSLRSIRSMNSEEFVHQNYAEQLRAYTRLLFLVEVFKNGIRFFPGIVALAIGITVLSPWGAVPVTLEASAIFAATTILIRVFLSLGALMTSGGALLIDGRAAKDLSILISIQEPTHADKPLSVVQQQRRDLVMQRIELVGISYSYKDHRKVLDNLSLCLLRGHSYAVVGPSGTGKSTLADVLLGLITPTNGELRINGHAVDGAEMRNRVILVEQQPRLFSISVRENLTLGLTVTDLQVAEAIAAVEMTAHVAEMPQGIDTMLEYQGANLSGGQRQRLSIARALLRKPEVLILDEATSALDTATEVLVIRSVKQAMHDGILMLITHDTEIASEADDVINLHPDAQALIPEVTQR